MSASATQGGHKNKDVCFLITWLCEQTLQEKCNFHFPQISARENCHLEQFERRPALTIILAYAEFLKMPVSKELLRDLEFVE